LKKSVLAFVRLRSTTNLATRSWAFVHNGLSSALLLAFMRHSGVVRDGEDTRGIQALLVQSLTEKGNEDSAAGPSQFSDAHRKALMALQTLQRLPDESAADRPPSFAMDQGPPNGLVPPPQGTVFDFQDQ
jgi:hypothetical protein